jgi:uncharacterized protein (TIGR02246 family)
MHQKMTVWAFVGAAVLAAACGGGVQEQTAAATPDPRPINELRAKFQEAYNAGDAAAVAALYTDDAVSLPDHHPAAQGKPAIQQYLQETFAQYAATMAITPADTEISGNLAHEHGTYTIKVTPKAGGETVTDDGKYVVILKRGADGAWKIHHDIDNSNRMPAMPTQATGSRPK